MFKIWAKVMKEGKIVRQFVYENEEKLTWSHFMQYMFDICRELDVPTPVVLKSHIFNFAKFNHVPLSAPRLCGRGRLRLSAARTSSVLTPLDSRKSRRDGGCDFP